MQKGAFSLSLRTPDVVVQVVSAQELFATEVAQIRKTFASVAPKILRYALPKSNLVGLMLVSPVGQAVLSPTPFASDATWASALKDDTKFYSSFVKDLASIGFRSGTTDGSFFGPYDRFGQYLHGKKKHFRSVGQGWSLTRRAVGVAVPIDLAEKTVQIWADAFAKDGCRSFVSINEEDANADCAPRKYYGIGRLLAMPASALRQCSAMEMVSLLRDVQMFADTWREDRPIHGCYLDLARGGLGIQLTGELMPSNSLEIDLVRARLNCVRLLNCRNFSWILRRITSDARAADFLSDSMSDILNQCDSLLATLGE